MDEVKQVEESYSVATNCLVRGPFSRKVKVLSAETSFRIPYLLTTVTARKRCPVAGLSDPQNSSHSRTSTDHIDTYLTSERLISSFPNHQYTFPVSFQNYVNAKYLVEDSPIRRQCRYKFPFRNPSRFFSSHHIPLLHHHLFCHGTCTDHDHRARKG